MIEGLSSHYPEKTFYLGQVFNDTATSYKLVWFLALLSLLRRKNDSAFLLSEIFTEMAAVAWHPVCLFRLSLGRQDKLQEAVLEIRERSLLPADSNSETIRKLVDASPETQARLDYFKRYVPTRFLAPWFATNLTGVQDFRRGNRILQLAKESQATSSPTLYWIDGASVRINKSWRAFLVENMAVVRGFAEYHLAHYLQARNPNVPGIVNKMRAPTERDLRLAREFWQFVRDGFQTSGRADRFRDIYSERPLLGAFAIDHFLPWSFVAHDLLWNLAPVEQVSNSSKGDSLPDLETYLPRLVTLHVEAVEFAKKRPKLLEDYTESFKLDIPGLLALGEDGLQAKYLEVMSPQAQIAINQGFQAGWKLASLTSLPEPRRKVIMEPADERYQKAATLPTISIERFPRDREAQPSADYLPYYPLAIAAGGFRQDYEPDPEGWVNVRKLGCTKQVGEAFFVTQVVGKSMEPTIRDGAYCVFRKGVSGTRQNCVLLVQKRDFTDPETGGGYTVKRYESTKSRTEDGWEHERIRLMPDNPDRAKFRVLEFSAQDDADLQVIAEFVQMLALPD